MSVSSLIGARNGSQTDLRTRNLLGAAALLLAIIVIRSPGLLFGVLNVDETDFLLIARRVLAGGLPYVDAVEMKPPLAYVAYLPGALVGFRMWPMQLLGFALPWTVALSFYAARGELAAFWEWNLFRNLGYISVGTTGQPILRAAKAIVVCVLGATPLPWLLSLRGLRGPSDRIRTALALLLVLTWIPVCMGGRFYEHYFLQFVPPLALLGAPVLVKLWEQWPVLPRWSRLTLPGLAVLPPLATLVVAFWLGLTHRYPTQNPRAVELARWLDAHSQPVDKLFVWGHFSPIYYLAEREPGTRYLSTSVHMGNFDPHHLPADFDAAAHRSEVDVVRTIHELELNKSPWI